jgi:hypothetical protein
MRLPPYLILVVVASTSLFIAPSAPGGIRLKYWASVKFPPCMSNIGNQHQWEGFAKVPLATRMWCTRSATFSIRGHDWYGSAMGMMYFVYIPNAEWSRLAPIATQPQATHHIQYYHHMPRSRLRDKLAWTDQMVCRVQDEESRIMSPLRCFLGRTTRPQCR